MKKKIVSLMILLLAGAVFASIEDKVLRFSTPGVDRYADGSPVVDGECYALVWSPKGTAFSGFNADGTAFSDSDRVVLAAPLAKDGRCIDTNFQIPKKDYDELEGGEWAVCLVDTRMVNGVPAGVRDGKPLRVNRWGAVTGGVEIDPVDVTGQKAGARRLASTGGTRSVASNGGRGATVLPVRASTLSAVPPDLKPPTITAIEVQDGEVWLGVADTVPYLSYTIVSGETPTDFKTDYSSEVVDGETGAEIAIGTVETPKRRFFKVVRKAR